VTEVHHCLIIVDFVTLLRVIIFIVFLLCFIYSKFSVLSVGSKVIFIIFILCAFSWSYLLKDDVK